MLPKLDLPHYDLTLPVSGKKLKYRPFTVKEEKNLLISMQDSDPNVALGQIEQVVAACTNGDVSSFDDYSQVDMEYLFINIRNKSMGEGVEIRATCTNPECGKKTNMTIDLSGVKIVQKSDKINPEVQISDDMWIVFHYPSLRNTFKLSENSDEETVLSVVASCMDRIVKGERSYEVVDTPTQEVVEWLGALTKTQFEKINDYFRAAPKLVYENEYTCRHCGTNNKIYMEGMDTFFG